MRMFVFSEKLSIRVGRQGVWIWAPAVAAEPIYLDVPRLAEMGLVLLETREGRGGTSSGEWAFSSPPFPAELKRSSQ